MSEDTACDDTGLCVAPAGAEGIASCIHCGKELNQSREGWWYTWDAAFFRDPEPQAQET